MKKYNLIPIKNDRAKSFYGKAVVIDNDNGEMILQSYGTDVCKIIIDGEFVKFVRLWSGYSKTTMRHVNSFLGLYNIGKVGKIWWNNQPIVQ